MRKKEYTVLPPDREEKVLGIFVKDASFYRTFFPLLFVIVLQQLAALAVNLADNIMLGRYSELALSGASLVNQLQFTLQQIAAGIGMGIVVLAAQYWGQKRTGPIKKIISLGVKCGFFSGVIFFAISQLAPAGVLGLFTRDEAVIAEGVRYLQVICWTYPVFGLSNSLMYALQSVETAMIGTVMSCSTICINVCLNDCFIYGNFGAPELGIVGAAVATLVSRLVELGIILVYILFRDKKLHMKLWELLRWDGTYLQDYLKVSTPIVISGLLWGVAQAAQTAIPGHMSATAIAANSIAIILFEIFAVLGAACANTASVVTGKTIGAGKLDKVKAYSKTMQGIFLLGGLFSGGMLFLCKDWIVNFYTVSPEVKAMAVDFMTVLSVASIGSCYEYPVEGGIIAGGGSTKYAAVVDNLFMWLFTIPSAALSAFVFQFPPVVTFSFLKADQILKCIPNFITCNRYRWVKLLTRGDSN